MARHREIRNIDLMQELDDYYDEYSDDDYQVATQRMKPNALKNHNARKKAQLFDVNTTPSLDATTSKPKKNQLNDPLLKTKIMSCVAEIQNVVGQSIPEEEIRHAVIMYDQNFELALNSVLNVQCSRSKSTLNSGKKLDTAISSTSFTNLSSEKTKDLKFTPMVIRPSATKKSLKGAVQDDDFEATFLGDIDIGSTKKSFVKKSLLSKATIAKNPDYLATKNELLHYDKEKQTAKEYLDLLSASKLFISTQIPLMELENRTLRHLRKKLIEVKSIFAQPETNLCLGINAKYLKSNRDMRFSVVENIQDFYEYFYREKLNDCPDEIKSTFESSMLGKNKGASKGKNAKTDQASSTQEKNVLKPLIQNQVRETRPITVIPPPKREESPIRIEPSKKKSQKPIDPREHAKEFAKVRNDSKPSFNLIVVGHVDAGKSTLMGHLLFKLGHVSSKKMHSYESNSKKIGKASFKYAWVLDETEEERSRGITMDIAQTEFDTPNRHVLLLDAPGHKDFIPNMISGAAQADIGILVVDATRGEFESGFEFGGQTREHVLLLKSLGVSHLAVAINKMDNAHWSKERYDEIVSKLKAFLKQAGYNTNHMEFVPCSGLIGENLCKNSELKLLTEWYNGPNLLDVIDTMPPPERALEKHLRLFVSDVFKNVGSSNLCITGQIEGGALKIGQKLVVMPSNEECIIKSIQVEQNIVETAFAGDIVNVTLANFEAHNINVGSIICEPEDLCPVVNKFQARVLVFHDSPFPITVGLTSNFHCKSLVENAVVKKLITLMDKNNGEIITSKPRVLSKNSIGIVEIQLDKTACLELYENYKNLGRFTLRYRGSTIAAGMITKFC